MKNLLMSSDNTRNKTLILFAVFMAVIFLLGSYLFYKTGFPLDDAWIHQTYARNLVVYKEWSFIPGEPTAGSTSPLWTLLLAVGYLLRIDNLFWAFLMGCLALGAVGIISEKIFWSITKGHVLRIPIFGLLIIGEWHFCWSAFSGMETILMVLLISIIFWGLTKKIINWSWMGLLVGIGIWIRPDSITLLGPLGLILIAQIWKKQAGGTSIFHVILGFIIPFLLYILFNYWLQGTWWPNTFYAKQLEYQSIRSFPLFTRYFNLIKQSMIGIGLLLVPGFFYRNWLALKFKEWMIIAMSCWWLGYNLVYAIFLPVTYQHGRYLIPAMIVYFLLSGSGSYELIIRIQEKNFIARITKRVWVIGICVIWLVFLGLGVFTYSRDVAIIETEMVDTAEWVKENTESDDLIAAHDIGALGYYSERNILDLAGLISPEVILFIRDESKLKDYLLEEKASHLVTFPGWYPSLVKDLEVVYKSTAKYSPDAGGENMEVFLLR